MIVEMLGKFLLWEGKPAQIIAVVPEKSVLIKPLGPRKCPHCDGLIEQEVFCVIPGTSLWKEKAAPIETITPATPPEKDGKP